MVRSSPVMGSMTSLLFADVGNSIVQGVFKKMQTIVFAKLSLHGILVQDIAVLVVATDGIFVHVRMIAYS